MKKIKKVVMVLLVLSLFSISLVSALSPSGYINCDRVTDSSIRLNYNFRGGSDVSLFRGNTRINTWASSDNGDTDQVRRDIEDLRRKIDDIAKEIEKLLKGDDAIASFPSIPSGFRFTRELGYGAVGIDVRYMQVIFNADPQTRVAMSGVGSPGQESDMFGNMTKNAVRRFQAKYASEILYPWNIQAPTGYAGMQTIKKLNRILEGSVKIVRIPPKEAAELILELQKIRDEINDIKRRIDDLGHGSSGSTGTFTDTSLSPNTTYTYYLRDGRTSTSPRIDTVFCYTSHGTEPPPPPPPTASGTLSCRSTGHNEVELNYSVTNATNATLFRGSLGVITVGSGTRSSTVRVGGLSANTSYTFYLRNGTSSSSTLLSSATCRTDSDPSVFTCGNTFTDTRDNISYKTVRIGNQCWFAEDLRHNNGCLTSDLSYANLRSGDNCIRQTSGYNAILYQWRTAMNGSTQERAQGLCPEGWQIPSDNDWKVLEISLGMTQLSANDTEWRLSGSVGQKLKTSTWGGNNSSGFSALPGGHYNRVGESLNPGNYGYWWTSTATTSTGAYHRTLRRTDSSVGRFASHYNGASSIRCIKN